MNTLNKIKLILYLLMFCNMVVYGQAKPQSKTENPKLLTRADVEKTLSSMSELIINGYSDKGAATNSKVISDLQLKEFEDKYKYFYNLPEIEKLTGNSREWFGKLLKIISELTKCSNEINNAIVRLKTDKIEPVKKRYESLQKVYKETFQNPEKAKPSRQ